MTKTLYISDLDGTLLKSQAQLSDYACSVINALVDAGGFFSVASSRSVAAASRILSHARLNVPAVLLNGTVIYGTQSKETIKVSKLDGECVCRLVDILEDLGQPALFTVLEGENAVTHYLATDRPHYVRYIEGGKARNPASFSEIPGLPHEKLLSVAYVTMWDDRDTLTAVYERLSGLEALSRVLYRDVYNDGMWFLECSDKGATKYEAALWLREYGGFDRLVGFGDNLNDLPLLRACDEKYAVANACGEVLECADSVIGACADDGVARFIAEREGVKGIEG